MVVVMGLIIGSIVKMLTVSNDERTLYKIINSKSVLN